MKPLHPCSVPGCGRHIPTDKLMCWQHWKRVPGYLKRKVYGAWHLYQDGQMPIEELREVQGEATTATTTCKASGSRKGVAS